MFSISIFDMKPYEEENNTNDITLNTEKQKMSNKNIDLILEESTEKFKPPIYYIQEKSQLNDCVIEDLELIETHKNDTNEKDITLPVYRSIIGDRTQKMMTKNVIKSLSKYYTTNTKFLKEVQKSISNIAFEEYTQCDDIGEKEILNIWNEIKNDNGFIKKYLYVDFDFFKFLNENEGFLQILCLTNIVSPLLSLLVPFFVFITPFIVIQLQGIKISFTVYKQVLMSVLEDHALGKIFTNNFVSASIEQKIYIIVSAMFYLYSIYQNIMTTKRFYNNTQRIYKNLGGINKYITITIKNMKSYVKMMSNNENPEQNTKHNSFINVVSSKLSVLEEIQKAIQSIKNLDLQSQDFNIFNVDVYIQLGKIYKIYYDLYNNTQYNDILLYSFGFNGYINVLLGLSENVRKKNLGMTKFLNKKKTNEKQYATTMKGLYHPTMIGDTNIIKNNCNLDKNIIITGVNASGKTTVLKSCLISVILSQQFGVGCFTDCRFVPYDFIHSYLNIIDTNDRLSLFQSETKKCQEILNIIREHPKKRHICIFDELYSGTNPDEAVICSDAFLKYLIKYDNVRFLLTTHFIDLANKMKNNSKIVNKKMSSSFDKTTQKMTYNYKLVDGVNEERGGVYILKEMNYPKDIICYIEQE